MTSRGVSSCSNSEYGINYYKLKEIKNTWICLCNWLAPESIPQLKKNKHDKDCAILDNTSNSFNDKGVHWLSNSFVTKTHYL